MSGSVIAIAPNLRLDLSALETGETSTIVLARAIDVLDGDEATLRVAVTSVEQRNPTPAQWFVELRPVVLGDGPEGDFVGDVIAEAAIDESAAAVLVIEGVPAGFGGLLRVAVRATQPSTGSPLTLEASVDLVLKQSEVGSADRLEALRAGERERVWAQGDEVLRRIAALTRRLGPHDWLDIATARVWDARACLAREAKRVACGCPDGTQRTESLLVNEVSPPWRAPPLPPGDLTTRPPSLDDAKRTCAAGVCCERFVLQVPTGLPPPLPATSEVEAEICYPSSIYKGDRLGLFIVTHGKPDGMPVSDWFDTDWADFRPLQHDLARAGVIALFILDTGGVPGMQAAISAVKLWIVDQAGQDPGGALASVDVDALQVAFGGNSQGGETAVLAASKDGGTAVRAVVGLASGGAEPGAVFELHDGTWYLGLVGTHDNSPNVLNKDPVSVFDSVLTDRPKLMVVLRGLAHLSLGPGVGGFGPSYGPYMNDTVVLDDTGFTLRSHFVCRFLRWALLDDDAVGRKLALAGANGITWGENGTGANVPAQVGPTETLVLARFPEAAADGPLQPFTARTIFAGDDISAVEAVSPSVIATEVYEVEDPTLHIAADGDVGDCVGGKIPAPEPWTAHVGQALFVAWDVAADGPNGAVIRFPIPEPLTTYVGGFQPPETFSIVIELALRVNAPANVPVVPPNGAIQWWPALGLGDADEPQAWVRPQPVLYGFGYSCPLLFSGEDGVGPDNDQRRMVFSSVAVPLPLFAPDGIDTATHVYLDLAWGAFQRGQCVVGRVCVVYHG